MKGRINIEFKKIEDGIIPIYESKSKERLINARELHRILKNKRQFANWIKQRIEQYGFIENKEYIRFNNFVKGDKKEYGNKNKEEIYYEIQYVKNTKNGKSGEIKEKGYKIENICYKIK